MLLMAVLAAVCRHINSGACHDGSRSTEQRRCGSSAKIQEATEALLVLCYHIVHVPFRLLVVF